MNTPRDHLFNISTTYSLPEMYQAGYTISSLLQQSQSFNLLCENEVVYFNNHTYSNNEELFSKIQQRLLLHRMEEIKIKNAKVKKGGFISVANGSRIQGTSHIGGLQPDYIIDTRTTNIKNFLNLVSQHENLDVWKKIDVVGMLVRQIIDKTAYDDPLYLQLLKQYKDNNLEIPLSEYLNIKRGVCREISLLTILGLNSIGVESYYYYAKVATSNATTTKEEDHAVVVCNINNELWVIDNYFRMFNKHKLDDLHSEHGVQCELGSMYDAPTQQGIARIFMSRLYPETRHNSNYIR